MNVFNHDNNTQNIYDLKNKVFKSFFHSLIKLFYSCVKKKYDKWETNIYKTHTA